MLIHECMTKTVKLADPNMPISEAAQMMRDGEFGMLPIGENDRLIGVVTDRDIALRAVADGKDPFLTKVREVMSAQIIYCYEDQTVSEVAAIMGDHQVRRLPVLNRKKRMVGIVTLGDLALAKSSREQAKEALFKISEAKYHQPKEYAMF